jgi:hypothetical protein
MWNTSCRLDREKNLKSRKITKNHKNYTSAPYFICSYDDDTVHFYRLNQPFMSRHMKNLYDMVDIGPQPDDRSSLPDLINKGECSISTAGDDNSTQRSGSDPPSLVNQGDDDDSTAQYDAEDACSIHDENDDIHLEHACAAKVTFVDDNNNFVSLDTGDDESIDSANSALDNIIISDQEGNEISHIPVANSASEDNNEMIEDSKPSAKSLQPEGKLDRVEDKKSDNRLDVKPEVNLAPKIFATSNPTPAKLDKSQVHLAPKIPTTNQPKLSNEANLDWLEKQNPILADSFAQEFHLSTNRSSRIFHSPKIVNPNNVPKSRHSPDPAHLDMSRIHHSIIDDIVEQYQELNEERQKDLWLSALASNDTELIQELTNFRVRNARVNSGTQLAKLTKDLLIHSEKPKITELKYEEQAGKRRLYFHNWLTRLASVINMFSQTASVLDADNEIVLFPDPNCVGN